MKQHTAIRFILFFALSFGLTWFATPQMASAQASLQLNIGTEHHDRPIHHRRHHRHVAAVVIAPRVMIHSDGHDERHGKSSDRREKHDDRGKHDNHDNHDDHH